MSINSISSANYSTPEYESKISNKEKEEVLNLSASTLEKSPTTDTVEFNKEEKETTSKQKGTKLAAGTVSFFVPGMSQIANGQTKKGLKMLIGAGACVLAGFTGFGPAALIPYFGLGAYCAVDAVKNSDN